jgi:hypothetical protein
MSTAEALLRTLESVNVPDSQMEPANVVDVLHSLHCAAYRIAAAITPNVVGCEDASGGHVESLTEAVIGITGGLCRIADAISELADAVRDAKGTP